MRGKMRRGKTRLNAKKRGNERGEKNDDEPNERENEQG
jgi:hypothetical protein